MAKPVKAVVDLLAAALGEARKGAVTSVAMVFVRPDGTVSPALAMGAGTAGDLYLATHLLATDILDEVRVDAAKLTAIEEAQEAGTTRIKLVGDN